MEVEKKVIVDGQARKVKAQLFTNSVETCLVICRSPILNSPSNPRFSRLSSVPTCWIRRASNGVSDQRTFVSESIKDDSVIWPREVDE